VNKLSKSRSSIPSFNRSEVAKIINVSTLTIANREKDTRYPEPKRDLNNYRIYTINDIIIDEAMSNRVGTNVAKRK